jgi:imidazolonepropionase-like amidohydrolase
LDARGSQGVHDVWLHEGRIKSFGLETEPPDARVFDGTGKTLLPGLIDAHVHISMAPGAAWREESTTDRRRRRAQHLRSYLAWGVTTLLDPAILPDDAVEIRALTTEGPAPRVEILGPTFSPPGGYVSVVINEFPVVATPEEVRELFAPFEDLEQVGVKVTMEDGLLGPIWPLHGPEVREAIQEEARRRDLELYIHALTPKMVREALDMEPRVLVHAPQKGGRGIARTIAAHEVYVVSTLSILRTLLQPYHLDSLDDPQVVATVPADELETARDQQVWESFKELLLETAAPNMPGWLRKLAVRVAGSEASTTRRLARAVRTTRLLHEAGVPLVLGSDSGNWPLMPYELHGPTTHVEMLLLAQAGLSPIEVIAAATSTPAKMLGLGDEIGTVELGKRADLIVVDGDPLSDLGVMRQLVWVVRDGEVRTPAEWMAEPVPLPTAPTERP